MPIIVKKPMRYTLYTPPIVRMGSGTDRGGTAEGGDCKRTEGGGDGEAANEHTPLAQSN